MNKRICLSLLAAVALLLAGCQQKRDFDPSLAEPIGSYNWMSGETPVPNERVGVFRSSVTNPGQTVSPQGTYFLVSTSTGDSYIWYVDHGSDALVKLCGRPDCSHSGSDCNAFVADGKRLMYDQGYLYVAAGKGNGDRLIRMDPDGANHITILDLQKFAQDNGTDYGDCLIISKGMCIFSLNIWVEKAGEFVSKNVASYMYKLDGSMEAPKVVNSKVLALYHCGDVFFSITPSERGTDGWSVWDWDPETDSLTYLTEYPGIPGYYGPDVGYYFQDGAIVRLTYATQTAETMIDTGLEEDYSLCCFPECMVLVPRAPGQTNTLYIYNWAYELVDTMEGPAPVRGDPPEMLFIGETAERFIFSDAFDGPPLYYINKADLGTGNARLLKFEVPT